MMNSLRTKMLRELWHMRTQVLAIVLVMAAGIGVCIMSLSTYDSLSTSRQKYYMDYHFADIFVDLTRAPMGILQDIETIKGVIRIQPRVLAPLTVKVTGFDEPIQGLVNSIPNDPQASEYALNKIHLVQGRLPVAHMEHEVVLSESFARQHRLTLGDQIAIILNGREKQLEIVGLGLSPEYVLQMAPGAMFPDFKRYAVMWMPYRPLAKAFDMDGAFNNLLLQVEPLAKQQSIIAQLDYLLSPYGGLGAYGREHQMSHQFLEEEFKQLKTTAFIFPSIFVSVSLFLLNVVLSRVIQGQREIIATLKAFGYSTVDIFRHYSAIALLISVLGALGGILLGLWLGRGMAALYVNFYRFAEFEFILRYQLIVIVFLVTLLISVLAIAKTIVKVAALSPAVAMQPPAPPSYRQSNWLTQGLGRFFLPTTKMIIRRLVRQPLHTLLSAMGLSLALAIMMVGNFQKDAINYMIEVQFGLQQKQDVMLYFNQPVTTKTLSYLTTLPGVLLAEGKRVVPVKLFAGAKSYRTAIEGLPEDLSLQSILNEQFKPQKLPEKGLLLSSYIAQRLGVGIGDRIYVEILSGRRRQFETKVSALSQELMGASAYMSQHQLNRSLLEADVINAALLRVNPQEAIALQHRLRDLPGISGINFRQAVMENSYETLDRIVLWFTAINMLLGSVIAFGVVYNTIRISLSERSRELASLRVLGYTEVEVAYVLLGEVALLFLLSIPIGFAIGQGLCVFIVENMSSEIFRVPLVLTRFTYALSVVTVLSAAILSSLFIWRKIKAFDLVAVLKTRA